MTKPNLPEALPEDFGQEVPGIFITKEKVHSMEIERIMVAGFAVLDILERTKLSQKAQEEAVDKLVDRTPKWAGLTPEAQVEKIKTVLTQETVIEYLRHEGIIRKKVDMVEVGVDEEGSVVVSAFYTNAPREVRRALQKHTSQKQQDELETAVNILAGDEDLVARAAAKIERMKEEASKPKVVPFKKRK